MRAGTSTRIWVLAALVALVAIGWLSNAARAEDAVSASEGGPEDPTAAAVMVSAKEPGVRLVITGTIYAEDGKTPVPNARLYVYQTDASGKYTKNFLSRTPRLRGWIKTGPDGRYEIRTIKPGSYPGEKIPAHIHGTLSAPGHPAEWIEDFWFDGDPFLRSEDLAAVKGEGDFAPVLITKRDPDGTLRARRDFQLPKAKGAN